MLLSFILTCILAAGDSLGVGIAQAGHLSNHAIVGITIQDKRLERVISNTHNCTILVSIGTNDAVAKENVKTFKQRLTFLDTYSWLNNDEIIWLEPPQLPGKFEDRARLLRKVIEENTMCHVDLSKLRAERAKDGIHFTSRGYQQLFSQIADKL